MFVKYCSRRIQGSFFQKKKKNENAAILNIFPSVCAMPAGAYVSALFP